MNRIDAIFAAQRAEHRKTLMPFFVGGHPQPNQVGSVLRGLQAGGASIVEIGLPFSDPVADGPVVASAMHEAIERGVSPEAVLDEIAAVRSELSLGLISMVSASIVYRLGGPGVFVPRAVERGIDGFIFPDVSLEEAEPYLLACTSAGATCSLLVAPTSSDDRAAAIANACSGFVYVLARSGITGERSDAPEISGRVARLRQMTDLPLAVGFGISNSAQVRAVVEHADAAIVGSALVRELSRATGDPGEAARAFAAELCTGLS